MPYRPTVTLYGRPDCHLCDEARDGLAALRSEGFAFDLRERNIDEDDDLLRRFLERIPVVELEGEIFSELEPQLDGLRARLATLSA